MIIINADDFGISRGVNSAILSCFQRGFLTSASLIIAGKYLEDAIKIYHEQNGKLKVGLHFNLSVGRSVLHKISIPLLVDNNGVFKNGFLKLFFLSINPFKRKNFLLQVKSELEAQINVMKINNINVSHIDSHRHVHFIPSIFKVVCNIAQKQGNLRVRFINESLFVTFFANKSLSLSGVIKWIVLRLFSLFNGKSDTYFFSIIFSCNLKQRHLNSLILPSKYNSVEVMIHPGDQYIDKDCDLERGHLTNIARGIEAQLTLQKI